MTKAWHKLFAREGVDVATIAELESAVYHAILDFTGNSEENCFGVLQNRAFTYYTPIDHYKLGQNFYHKYLSSPDQIIQHYKNGQSILRRGKIKVTKWQNQFNQKIDGQTLRRALADFYPDCQIIYRFFSFYTYISIESWQHDFNQTFSELIEKNGLEDVQDHLLAAISKPWKNTALLKVQEELAKGADPDKMVIKYQFLRSWSVIWYKPLDRRWIDDLARKEGRTKPTIQYSFNKALDLLKPNSEQKQYLEIAPYIIFFKDYRDDFRRSYIYLWSFLFDRIAKFLDVSRDELGYLTFEEINLALKKHSVDGEIIKQRRNSPCVLIPKDRQFLMKVMAGKIFSKYQLKIDEANQTNGIQEMKGLIAMKGVAEGKVQIVASYHDVKNFREGSILVANTTHPNYLPAMQKAAAFVTNEGGIISHAAIVSRELKKPCIVGTKIATQMLHDGDLVEVDANRGIVKIIYK